MPDITKSLRKRAAWAESVELDKRAIPKILAGASIKEAYGEEMDEADGRFAEAISRRGIKNHK